MSRRFSAAALAYSGNQSHVPDLKVHCRLPANGQYLKYQTRVSLQSQSVSYQLLGSEYGFAQRPKRSIWSMAR